MVFEDKAILLQKGQGIEIPPQIRHQFKNQSEADVHFLVVSMPTTRGDRFNVPLAAGDGG
jgi:mannose-6-phosphate isomerase-like protein (cupin superfamily)